MDKKKTFLILDHELYNAEAHSLVTEFAQGKGFEVTYRRYFPHFTPDDMDNGVVMIYAGRMPSTPGARMSSKELGPLKEYVLGGGVLVLCHGGVARQLSREHERYLFNCLLEELDAPIRINKDIVVDHEHGLAYSLTPSTYLKKASRVEPAPDSPIAEGLHTLAGSSQSSLMVGKNACVLLQTPPTAECNHRRAEETGIIMHVREPGVFKTAAAAPVGKGYVVVISRGLMNNPLFTGFVADKALGEPELFPGNYMLVKNITEYIADIATGVADKNYFTSHEVDEMPENIKFDFEVNDEDLPEKAPLHTTDDIPHTDEDTPFSKWVYENKIKGGYVCFYDKPQDDNGRYMAEMMQKCGFNTAFLSTNCKIITNPNTTQEEKEELFEIYRKQTRLLPELGYKCFIGSYYPYTDLYDMNKDKYSKLIDAAGNEYNTPSPLDIQYWKDSVFKEAEEIARLSLTAPGITGIFWDMEMYRFPGLQIQEGHGMENECFLKYVEAEKDYLGKEMVDAALALEIKERYAWLRDNGLLKRYYTVLEGFAKRIGEEIRTIIRDINPNMELALYNPYISSNWFYRGMVSGLSTRERPIVLITYDLNGLSQKKNAALSGSYFYAVGGMLLNCMEIHEWERALPQVAMNNDGYWIFPVEILQENRQQHESGDFTYKGSKEDNYRELKKANDRITQLLLTEKIKKKYM